jgi:lia operon protein LiaF
MKRWQIITGIVLVLLGFIALFEEIFMVDLWRFIWPLILIGLGVLLVLRPQFAGQDVQVQMPVLGEIRKSGAWEATQHEIWWMVGTNRLDFTEAVFPNREARVRIIGFVAEVSVILPEDVGLRVESSSIISELKSDGGERERFLSFLEYETPNFMSAEKRVTLQTIAFVSEIKVKSPLL